MSATSANSRSTRPNRNRLPLTPKVMSSRRGGHLVPRPEPTPAETAPVVGTPAMHITPNVVVAARGDVSLSGGKSFSRAYKAGALDMRGLRF
jgi:hypothetical protein